MTTRLRLLCAAGLVCLAVLALSSQASAATYTQSDAFYWSLPGGGTAAAIATSPDGNYVYVADATARRIVEFDSDGLFVRWWPRYNALRDPSSVTTDGFGNVYVLYRQSGTIVKYSGDGKKKLASWTVPFAGSIAATRAGTVYVLTNFLNAVGVYNSAGQSIGGFVANLPGQWFPRVGFDTRYWPQTGYDPPYKTFAREIAVDSSGNPIVVGDSYQALSDPEPDCSIPDHDLHIDTHPYPDPLDSGEAARFTSSGSPIAYGWLSESLQVCDNGLTEQSPGLYWAYGWQSDATDPGAVAVDPNSGDVFAVSGVDLGVIHLRQDLSNTYANVTAASSYGADHNQDVIAGNPPGPVTVDCQSNLYMIGGGAAGGLITKFINQSPVPAGTCTTLNRFSLAPPPSVGVFNFHVGKNGKGLASVGCSGRVCSGILSLKSSSPLCRGCTLGTPYHFHMLPGVRRPVPVQLTGLGQHLLRDDPGLPIKIFGRLKGGRKFVQSETLREPSTLSASCRFPGTAGGAVTVSGTLMPEHAGERITIQYVPPESHGLLLPAVQRTVLTNRGGQFADRYIVYGAGRWLVAETWAGDRRLEPANARSCSGNVKQISTQITLTCPMGSSTGAPSAFSGGLSGAPADARIALDYVEPPRTDISHAVSAGGGGQFSDSLSPTAPGIWMALAHYRGDSSHAPAEAVCEFIVSPNDFSMSVTPSAGSVEQGGSVSASVNTAVTSGAPQAVSLSAAGAPGPVTFAPSSVTAGGASTVSFAAPAAATPGTYVITLAGTGTWASHSTTYTLTVLAPLTLACSGATTTQIPCSGRLTSGGTGIGGAQVKLTYQPPPGAGAPIVDTTTTAANGDYTDTLTRASGLPSGTWQVQAQFAGDAAHPPVSTSTSVNVP